ncbi:rCG52329 [Rattus norvegicus]|uniref:RCG52329 n=1 Tax=Rattus norvegicus TaxID=10116 RepID=A6K0S0_RAT|nr:rCG52329 [Rattus norvegicus]
MASLRCPSPRLEAQTSPKGPECELEAEGPNSCK